MDLVLRQADLPSLKPAGNTEIGRVGRGLVSQGLSDLKLLETLVPTLKVEIGAIL